MYSLPWRPSLRRLSLLAAAAAGLLLAGLAASPAHADAIGGRNAVHFNLTCGGEEFVVVSPSEPAATIQIVGATTVLVATDAVLTTTYTDPQTGQPVTDIQHVVFGAGHGNANGTHDRTVYCTNTIVISDPDVGPITVTLVGQFILAPSP